MKTSTLNFADFAFITVFLLGLLLATVSNSIYFKAIGFEFFAIILGVAFLKPKCCAVAGFINGLSITAWPNSRHWLWLYALAINIAIITTLVKHHAL